MSDNNNALVDLIGFDPNKNPSITSDIFKEVVGEIEADRRAKAKEAAKTQLTEAIKLREEMLKVKKEFEKNWKNFDDKLGKLVSGLTRSIRGGNNTPQVESEVAPPSSENNPTS